MQLILLMLLISQTGRDSATNVVWTDLFNGKNYAGFTFWIIGGPERTFDVNEGMMVIHPIPPGAKYTTDRIIPISDSEILSRVPLMGYAYTRKQYRNFELKYEWKFERPVNLSRDDGFVGNSGVFVYLTRVLKSWPVSVEIDGRYSEMGKLRTHGKAQGEFKDHVEARKKAMKPVGQWNETLVTCNDGAMTVSINGQLVAEGKTDQREGAIGFQAQGSTIYYRNIKVREMK